MRNAYCPRAPLRVDVKYNVLPSADQQGALLSVAGDVNRTAGPPVVGTIHTSVCRRSSASITDVTVNAIFDPSGDRVGPATWETLYQSAGVNACFCAGA
jgi:hypothetical protein